MSLPDANPSRGQAVVIVAAVTLGFAVVAVSLRCYVRSRIVRSLGWDDWVLMLSLACAIVATGANIESVRYGNGHHTWRLSPSQNIEAARFTAIGEGLCMVALALAKLTVVLTFQRTIEGAGRRFANMYLWFNAIAAIVTSLATIIILYGSCTPVEKNYNPEIPGSCWSSNILDRVNLAQGVVAAATDFLLSLFPTAMLYKLNMPLRTKITIIFLMSLGCVAGAVAVVRTVYTGPYNRQNDPTWTSTNLTIWAIVERNIAIFLISLPALPKLVSPLKSLTTDLLPRKSRTTSSQTEKTHQNYFTKNSSEQSGLSPDDEVSSMSRVLDEDPVGRSV